MEFRLLYTGRLHAQTVKRSPVKEKHSIRKQFHRQLVELWKQHPLLRGQLTEPVLVDKVPSNIFPNRKRHHVRRYEKPHPEARPYVEHVANDFQRYGYRFVPLVSKSGGLSCSLDILFLRRDNPGNLVKSGGDIDNRIKVLLDGLRMPDSEDEIGGFKPESHEDPFFCLLEDDDLITGMNVNTDRLLLNMSNDENPHDVHLVILVKTKVIDPDSAYSDVHSH